MKNEMDLRAHHYTWLADVLPQIEELESEGKLDQFTPEFREELKSLREHGDTPVRLVEGPDYICRHCSHYDSAVGCNDPDKHYEGEPAEIKTKLVDTYTAQFKNLERIKTLDELLELNLLK